MKSATGTKDEELLKEASVQTGYALSQQTIKEYFERDVKPHLPEAWMDENKTKIGYEINFTNYFYEFKLLGDIKAYILALEEKVLATEKMVLE